MTSLSGNKFTPCCFFPSWISIAQGVQREKERKGSGEANKVQLQFFWAFLQNSYRQSCPAIYQDLTLFVDSTSVLQTRLSRDVSLILRETGSSIFLEKILGHALHTPQEQANRICGFPGWGRESKKINTDGTKVLLGVFLVSLIVIKVHEPSCNDLNWIQLTKLKS